MEAGVGSGNLATHLIVITQDSDSPLRRIASRKGLPLLDHHPHIGGRYSCFSTTGLLPAMIAGIDARALLAGARTVLDDTLNASAGSPSPSMEGAALLHALARNAPIAVVMPYLDRLENLAIWHRQLVAESLGKSGSGITPVPALGTVDQHSQLQLYLDGPTDKYFTLICGDPRGTGNAIDDGFLDLAGDLEYLRNRQMGDVLAAEQEATIDALVDTGQPVRTLRLGRTDDAIGVDSETVGALMMHFILETIIAADLFGVNPFDQPAVEAGKTKARNYLGDFASLATKIDSA
jgi:glucose-6-phosphate isomerase